LAHVRSNLANFIPYPLFNFLIMLKNLSYSYYLLVALTLIVAAVGLLPISKGIVITIVLLSLIKFLLVGFQFMEMKQAHIVWKVLLVAYGTFIATLFIVLL
jgi:hypothetical protein